MDHAIRTVFPLGVPFSVEREVARPGSMNLLYYPGSRVMRRIVHLAVIEIYSGSKRVGRR